MIKSENLDNDDKKYNVHLKKDPETGEPILYRVVRDSEKYGDIQMVPALPNQKIIELICNNRRLITDHPDVVQRVLNMEWRYLRRRIIPWMGDTPESRELVSLIENHIKSESKWYSENGKNYEIRLR